MERGSPNINVSLVIQEVEWKEIYVKDGTALDNRNKWNSDRLKAREL